MAIFLTGATGYIGSYIASGLLRDYDDRLALLVRAKTTDEAEQRLWKSLQLHFDFDTFSRALRQRIDIYRGDLTSPEFGLEADDWKRLVASTDSVIHCAASLNRKSEKACLNVNLRGTLQVIKLARAAHRDHGVRRFSDISTVAVAGKRENETVREDEAIEWDRSDYDPYARTKKFCEHMIDELLPDVPHTVFRPSIVLGDSRFPQTTQFDMVRAFVWLAQFPLLPFRETWRADIVPADYVGKAVVTIHQKKKADYGMYHLSSGRGSITYKEIVSSLAREGIGRDARFVPVLAGPFSSLVNLLASTPRSLGIARGASLMKVFWPYLTYNTVFDNQRVENELGEAPKPFSAYAHELFRYAKACRFRYRYLPWPSSERLSQVA